MLEGLQSVRQVTVRLLSTLLLDISTTSRSQRNTAPNGPSRTTQTVPNRPDGPKPENDSRTTVEWWMGTVASLLSGETAKIQILHRGHPTVNGSLKEKGSRQCVTSSLGPFLRVSFNTHRYPEPTTMVASVSYGASGPDGPRAWVPLRVEPYASLDVGLFNSPFTWVGKALHVGERLFINSLH